MLSYRYTACVYCCILGKLLVLGGCLFNGDVAAGVLVVVSRWWWRALHIYTLHIGVGVLEGRSVDDHSGLYRLIRGCAPTRTPP